MIVKDKSKFEVINWDTTKDQVPDHIKNNHKSPID